MQGTTVAEMPFEATGISPLPPEVIPIQTAEEPDESWPDAMLLDCGREAIKESDLFETQAQPFIRQSIGSRLRGGHALSILRARLKAEGRWLIFQQDNTLPRTTVWQMIEVYERAAKNGHSAQVLVEKYGNWTGILLAYGLAKPQKNKVGGYDSEQREPPEENKGNTDDKGSDNGESDGKFDDDTNDDADEGESPDPDPEETADAELSPVTDDQFSAAEAFVSAVGGLEHAIRVLVARSIKSGEKDAVKSIVAEVVRAARALLTASEINEIVIAGNAQAKGFRVVSL
jgi:hypothetical protein